MSKRVHLRLAQAAFARAPGLADVLAPLSVIASARVRRFALAATITDLVPPAEPR